MDVQVPPYGLPLCPPISRPGRSSAPLSAAFSSLRCALLIRGPASLSSAFASPCEALPMRRSAKLCRCCTERRLVPLCLCFAAPLPSGTTRSSAVPSLCVPLDALPLPCVAIPSLSVAGLRRCISLLCDQLHASALPRAALHCHRGSWLSIAEPRVAVPLPLLLLCRSGRRNTAPCLCSASLCLGSARPI